MKNSYPRAVLLIALLNFCSTIRSEDPQWKAEGTNGAVASGSPRSVAAGIEILKQGGNAMDAAAATILALTVTDHGSFCFGGEVPVIVFDANRKVTEVISGMGTAPQLATLNYFKRKGLDAMPPGSLESAAIPATLGVVIKLLERYGTMTFGEVAAPMLKLLTQKIDDPGPKFMMEGRSDLAETLKRLIEAEKNAGPDRLNALRAVDDYFYRGPIAEELDLWSRKNGGLLRYSDMATYRSSVEEPVTAGYRGYTICKCNTWTQGPYLLQTLRLLEGFDLNSMKHNSPDYIHTVLEAMKLALADRDEHYGDPLFVDVPLDALLSDEYTTMRRQLMNMHRASDKFQPGDPVNMKPLLDKSKTNIGVDGIVKDTTTCTIADKYGNLVAATPSGWGSKIKAGKTGIWLGTRLISFNLWKGHSNCIEPGKRPRITLTPTIVKKDDRAVMAVSVKGGDWQDQSALQLILNSIDFGFNPENAVSAPRFSTKHFVGSFMQGKPELGSLLHMDFPDELINKMKQRGHKIIKAPSGKVSMLTLDPATGQIKAAGYPIADRHADAF